MNNMTLDDFSNNMTLDDFSPEILNHIFLKLPLEQIQECSKTCKKFNLIISADFFWKNLEAQEIKKANFNLLKKYESKLSAQQIAYFDFKQTPEEMIKSGFFDKNEKNHFFIRLSYALSRLRREFMNSEGLKHRYGKQIHYAHLMFCWGYKDLAFKNCRIKSDVCKNLEMKKIWEKTLKEMEDYDKLLLQEICNDSSKSYQNFCNVVDKNHLKLQIESSEELTNFYSVLWKEYSPKDLNRS